MISLIKVMLHYLYLNNTKREHRYRELRRSGKDKHHKGGGIGFYEIVKRTSKIKYSFKQLDKERFEFEFISFLVSSK